VRPVGVRATGQRFDLGRPPQSIEPGLDPGDVGPRAADRIIDAIGPAEPAEPVEQRGGRRVIDAPEFGLGVGDAPGAFRLFEFFAQATQRPA